MQRCIVIADAHGQPWLIQNALDHAKYDPDRDRLVFAGDLVDIGFDALDCIRLLKENHAELLCGNHDLAIVLGKRIWPQNSFDHETESAIIAMKDEFKIATMSYGFLITHAGLAKSFKLPEPYSIPGSYSDDLNHMLYDELWTNNSPLWYRPTPDNLPRDIPQIVGHTPPEWIKKSVGKLPNFMSVDPYCSKSFDKKRYRYVAIENSKATLFDSMRKL